MTRNLHELDKVYNKLNQVVGVDERIKYCVSLIQKTREVVTSKRENLTETLITKSSELINSAEIEIMKLYNYKNKRKSNY